MGATNPLHIHDLTCQAQNSGGSESDTSLVCGLPGLTVDEFDALTVIDGLLVDTDTGEVFGLARDAYSESRFAIGTDSDAEWVIERIFNAESEVAALDAKLAAILANIDAMKRQRVSAIAHLKARFEAELQHWAAGKLAYSKSRSIKTEFGTVGFRTAPGKIEAIDLAAAIAWADQHAPEAVKRDPRLLVSGLKGREAELPDDIFTCTEKHDKFYVETGVGKAAKKGSE